MTDRYGNTVKKNTNIFILFLFCLHLHGFFMYFTVIITISNLTNYVKHFKKKFSPISEGGGDEPEAVAQILKETITDNDEWSEDAAKVAFMIFDAPPHEGTEDTLKQAVETTARKGIRLVPVVASNSTRDTELFGRAIAITTNGTYVFLTDDSGIGETHLEPIVGDYTVELLHDVIVRIISENR